MSEIFGRKNATIDFSGERIMCIKYQVYERGNEDDSIRNWRK